MTKRKPILEGVSRRNAKPGNYRFVRWIGDGCALFQETEAGKLEVFASRAGGYSGWQLFWRGTSWEFCRSY